MIEEKISEHLGKPYIYLKDKKMFLCSNGVPFTLEEYKNGIDINKEYERREKEDMLYDYNYAKNTGLLRRKRGYAKMQVDRLENDSTIQEGSMAEQDNEGIHEEPVQESTPKDISLAEPKKELQDPQKVPENGTDGLQNEVPVCRRTGGDRRDTSTIQLRGVPERQNLSVAFIIALLAFTSLISGYISTLQTATYLYDYVDMISAWLMSASVTAYNVTAFEVAVLFKQNRRYGLTFVFITLWVTVTVFSMATAVSVFYDRFNFNETAVAEDNRAIDSNKLSLEILQKKEADLREAIAFKKQDIEYRQEHDYATTAVRNELVKLEADLQSNLSAQQDLLADTPEVTQEVIKKKERLFAFLGRMLHVDSGVFEFIMSTLSAIFVNLIAPLSLVAVTELKKKKLDKPSIV